MVSTHGHLAQKMGGRSSYNFKKLKTVIIDEADEFFKDQLHSETIRKIVSSKDFEIAKPQWVLFSATFTDGVNQTD